MSFLCSIFLFQSGAYAEQALTQIITSPQTPLQALDSTCGSIHPTQGEIKALVKATLQSKVAVLDRKVFFYHYGKQWSPVPYDASLALAYGKNIFLNASSSYFGKPDPHGGLYVAPDPLMTLDFSGDPGFLLRIGIPEGKKFLNTDTINPTSGDSTRIWCYPKIQLPIGCLSENSGIADQRG